MSPHWTSWRARPWRSHRRSSARYWKRGRGRIGRWRSPSGCAATWRRPITGSSASASLHCSAGVAGSNRYGWRGLRSGSCSPGSSTAPSIHPACRAWARAVGRDPGRLVALGDAPNWTARAEGLKRLLEGRPVTADPWRLFPPWLREHLPLPPGGGTPKWKFLELLHALQRARRSGSAPREPTRTPSGLSCVRAARGRGFIVA